MKTSAHVRQIWAAGHHRGSRPAITSSPAVSRVALAICLFGMLLSACVTDNPANNALNNPVTPTGTVTIPTPIVHPPARPGTRGAGINVEPSYRPWRYLDGPAPESWWCAPPNCSPNEPPQIRIETDLSLANQLGVNMVRVEFPWRFLEPRRGAYDWTRADLIVKEAVYYHVQLQPVVVYSPAWVGAPTAAPAPDDFRTFMTALVSRYRAAIHYWELWNEPDLDKYWSAGEQAYVKDILIPGNQGIKAADPSAQVVVGGPSWASGDWFHHIYDYGGGDSFDIVSWHAYGDVNNALASTRNMQLLMAYHHQSNKPLWIGEYGLQDSSVSDSTQVSLLTGVLTSNSAIAQADWYTLRDEASMECCPPTIAVLGSYGLVRRDGVTPKAGFYALQRLISKGLPTVNTSR
jgi:cellulase (glycosyl hydrolase family 5)